jgi:hypothetical protein
VSTPVRPAPVYSEQTFSLTAKNIQRLQRQLGG